MGQRAAGTRPSRRSRGGEYSAAALAAVLLLHAAAPPAAHVAAGEDVPALLAEGDAHYARRGEGAHGGTADPRETDLAIAAYRRALAAAPADLFALARLLRAFNFRGAFCGADLESRKKLFEEGRTIGQAAVD